MACISQQEHFNHKLEAIIVNGYSLYHAIENTDNQNSVKLLYTQRYSTQPSNRVLRIFFPPKISKSSTIYFQFLSNVVLSSLSHVRADIKVFYVAVFTKRQDHLKASWKPFTIKSAHMCHWLWCALYFLWHYIKYFIVVYHGISHTCVTCIFSVYHSKALHN